VNNPGFQIIVITQGRKTAYWKTSAWIILQNRAQLPTSLHKNLFMARSTNHKSCTSCKSIFFLVGKRKTLQFS